MHVNAAEFARIIGKSRTSVENHVARGMPGYTQAGNGAHEASVHLEEAIPWLMEWAQKELDRARTLLTNEQTAKTKLEVQRIRGETLDRKDFGFLVENMIVSVRARLMNLGRKMAPLVAAPDKVRDAEKKLDAEARSILEDLASGATLDEVSTGTEKPKPNGKGRARGAVGEVEAASEADG